VKIDCLFLRQNYENFCEMQKGCGILLWIIGGKVVILSQSLFAFPAMKSAEAAMSGLAAVAAVARTWVSKS
jgi:hypothetical protein